MVRERLGLEFRRTTKEEIGTQDAPAVTVTLPLQAMRGRAMRAAVLTALEEFWPEVEPTIVGGDTYLAYAGDRSGTTWIEVSPAP